MSDRSAVWSLLLANQGRWTTRDEIERYGGYEAMRRLREVRESAFQQGFECRQQPGPDGKTLQYMLVPITSPISDPLRSEWACTKCGSRPVNLPQPSTDTLDRYRLAWCGTCNKKKAIFARPVTSVTGVTGV